jgi:hypothetical protein
MIPRKRSDPSLLSPEQRGGVTAGEGYNFQDAFIVSQIPAWLADPSFDCLLKEGLGDVEVLFDDYGAKRRDFYQVKDHHVPPAECRDIVQDFFNKESKSPGTYSKFILACRSLGGDAESLRQAIEELRGAYPMYNPGDKIVVGTERDIQERATRIGLDISIDFLGQKVFFDTDLGDMKTDERLCEQFVGSIVRRVPKWAMVGGLGLSAAYREIAHLINISIRQTCNRNLLEQKIQQAIDTSPVRLEREGVAIRLYHWEDPSFDLSQKWDVLLDWSEHFDRANRKVPDPTVWRDRLISALEEVQRRVRASSNSRHIHFRPSACLSAGFALGWAFSEVKGYTFEVQQGPAMWKTEEEPSNERHLVLSEDVSSDHTSKELCVEFSQQAKVGPKVDEFVRRTHIAFRGRIELIPDIGIGKRIDGPTVLAYANEAKQFMRQAVDKYGCRTVHLFYAGPLGLAIFLGRLFNAMHADIQCYEEQYEGGYTPSCLLHT